MEVREEVREGGKGDRKGRKERVREWEGKRVGTEMRGEGRRRKEEETKRCS